MIFGVELDSLACFCCSIRIRNNSDGFIPFISDRIRTISASLLWFIAGLLNWAFSTLLYVSVFDGLAFSNSVSILAISASVWSITGIFNCSPLFGSCAFVVNSLWLFSGLVGFVNDWIGTIFNPDDPEGVLFGSLGTSEGTWEISSKLMVTISLGFCGSWSFGSDGCTWSFGSDGGLTGCLSGTTGLTSITLVGSEIIRPNLNVSICTEYAKIKKITCEWSTFWRCPRNGRLCNVVH